MCIRDREEAKRIEYCDYHLGEFDTIGTEILTYVNTDRVCAKEMMLTPYQICPEHLHPQLGDYQGKEETFRCRWGEVYLYVPGEPTAVSYTHLDVYKRQKVKSFVGKLGKAGGVPGIDQAFFSHQHLSLIHIYCGMSEGLPGQGWL